MSKFHAYIERSDFVPRLTIKITDGPDRPFGGHIDAVAMYDFETKSMLYFTNVNVSFNSGSTVTRRTATEIEHIADWFQYAASACRQLERQIKTCEDLKREVDVHFTDKSQTLVVRTNQ